MKKFKTKISKIIQITDDVIEISLKIVEGRMDFKPGQFVTMKVSDNPIVKRAYSILKYDKENNEVIIAIKKVDGGQATTIIFDTFKCGLEVEIFGPLGGTLVVDKSKKDIMLVATGIGITPILCVLEDLVDSNYDGNIELIYGNRTLRELYYIDKIKDIAKNNENVKLTKVLSHEYIPGIHKGFVTDIVKENDLSGKHIYMCCSKRVASSFKEVLEGKNFDLSNFSCESA